jgi:cytosine/uracil/thiamine/allantoin permease
LEGFFGRNFLGGIYCENFFGRIFGRIVFGGTLWEEFILMQKELICLSRFWFLSRFWVKAEGKKISIFRSTSASLSHLKIVSIIEKKPVFVDGILCQNLEFEETGSTI